MANHKAGQVAVFIGCDDRVTLDKLKAKIEKKTGYPVTYRAVLHRLIAEAEAK